MKCRPSKEGLPTYGDEMELIASLLVAVTIAVVFNGVAILIGRAVAKPDDKKTTQD